MSNLITEIFKSRVFSGCWQKRKPEIVKAEEYLHSPWPAWTAEDTSLSMSLVELKPFQGSNCISFQYKVQNSSHNQPALESLACQCLQPLPLLSALTLTRLPPVTGPSTLLFLLPGTLFPSLSAWLTSICPSNY